MSLSLEARTSYTAIIDGILHVSDLNTITSKQIRTGLQSAVDHDLTPQKDAIRELIMERFGKVESIKATTSKKHANNSELMLGSGDDSHPVKKAKRMVRDEDAVFAAQLQAEENSRARATRGNASGKRQAPTKTLRKKPKSAARIKTNDDGNLRSASEGEEKATNRSGAFHKPMMLSSPLANLLGETTLSRPQTVKKIWEYVRQHDLQNPNDKRQILCDENMKAVFKQDAVHMFTMNKILSKHLHPVEE